MKRSKPTGRDIIHYLKSVQIRSFFWSVFSHIRTEYVNLRILSEYGKKRTRKTPYLHTFHAVTITFSHSLQFKCSYFYFSHILRDKKYTSPNTQRLRDIYCNTWIVCHTNLKESKSYWTSQKQKPIIFQTSGYTTIIKLLGFIQTP